MKKIILLSIFVPSLALAQFELNDGNVSASAIVEEQKQDKKENKKSFDDIFSFMDFSFGKSKSAEISKKDADLPLLTRLENQAKKGDAEAQSALGFIYLYGDKELDVKQDYKKAFEYYTLSADQNNIIATNNLANLYYSGLGVEKNKVAAAKLFQKAATMGNQDATLNLAFMYLNGDGIAKNPKYAISWLQKAAEKGSALAKYMIGISYHRGYVLEKNYNKAFDNIKQAADMGYDEAQVSLAQLYINGEGAPQNYGIAISLLNQAVKQDNLTAMYNLANVLKAGRIYPQDLFNAHILYNLASVRGQYDAAANRAQIEKDMDIKQILEAQGQANAFVPMPSKTTLDIRKTFGTNLQALIKK